jgi:hypothetical protein
LLQSFLTFGSKTRWMVDVTPRLLYLQWGWVGLRGGLELTQREKFPPLSQPVNELLGFFSDLISYLNIFNYFKYFMQDWSYKLLMKFELVTSPYIFLSV